MYFFFYSPNEMGRKLKRDKTEELMKKKKKRKKKKKKEKRSTGVPHQLDKMMKSV